MARRARADRPLVANSANPKQVKRGQEAEALRRHNELADLRAILERREGRRFLWRWLGKCGLYSQTYREGKADTTAFLEGQRGIGLELFAELNAADANQYALMVSEDIAERATEQAEREAAAIDDEAEALTDPD